MILPSPRIQVFRRLGLQKFFLVLLCIFVNNTVFAKMEDLSKLLAEHKSAQAYKLAGEMLEQYAGDPEFDYLYAKAAIDSGAIQHAIFALERVIGSQPDHNRARLDLAMAFFNLKNYSAAKEQFDILEKSDVPSNVKEIISRYKVAIERQGKAKKTSISPYINITTGFDSNVNAATTASSINTAATGLLTFSESSQKKSDEFLDMETGIRASFPLYKKSSLSTRLQVKGHFHDTEHEFDYIQGDALMGLTFAHKNHTIKLPVTAQNTYFNGDIFSRTQTVGITENYKKKRDQLWASGNLGRSTYPKQELQNINFYTLGMGWRRVQTPHKTLWYLNSYYGRALSRNVGGEHNANVWYGVYAGLYHKYSGPHTVFVTAGYTKRLYAVEHNVFLVRRNEDSWNMSVGNIWVVKNKLFITPELKFAKRNSNVVFYTYKRLIAQIKFGYDF